MQVARLRLLGFKSFVDAAELVLEPGLTGIVGPNGCGKSNLVEALGWVMGENSAKRLRGGEMDDVIFAGAAGRPARNLAEVSLKLDNAARDAPFAFNESDEVEVTRRIERGGGSVYRVNGREVRARDVQLLFADAATGPHSGALVSQGRIGALIAAKPGERRVLLDEAAGTAGLQARRHEAELKLKAADDNLLRLDDVVATLAAQLDALKKQARQAQRYRRLAEQIRRTEALVLHLRWQEAGAEAARVAGLLRATERDVAAATETALAARRACDAAQAELPPRRLAEPEAAAALQRLAHAREALEGELARMVAARAEAERRLQQIAADLRREDEHVADSGSALRRLAGEREHLAAQEQAADPALREAAEHLRQAGVARNAAEAEALRQTEACAADEARRAALDRQRRDAGQHRSRLAARLADAERQHATAAAQVVPPQEAAAAAAALGAAEEAAQRCRAAAEECAPTLAACQAAEAETVDRARETERRRAGIAAEIGGLEAVLGASRRQNSPGEAAALLSLLRVPEGLEAAVAAIFGDALSAPLFDAVPAGGDARNGECGWIALGPLAAGLPLPADATPLAELVEAPGALSRRLALTGLVAGEAEGWAWQARLAPGQRLVDRTGRVWRWDGYVSTPSGASAAEQQLRQRNRLAALTRARTAADAEAARAEEAAGAARRAREAAAAAERQAAANLREAEAALSRRRAAEAELTRRALTSETRLASLAAAIAQLTDELAESESRAAATERELALLPASSLARAGLETARNAAAAARRQEGEARAALDRLTRDGEARRRRLAAVADEVAAWGKRHDGAVAQRAALGERQAALAEEIAGLAARPAAIAAESEALAAASARAAERRRVAADAVALAETRLRQAGEAARQADASLAGAREQRARLEVLANGAAAAIERMRGEINERVDAAPDDLAELAELAPDQPPPDREESERRLDRLLRERDAMGPVNLVAEEEAVEVEERIAGLQRERRDLTEAIARLRRGIATLDQEARKRVIAAVERLNEHFAALFARLFGGGRAHLALEEGVDPLSAGLEIIASPPGKRLQSLSLLSGGEQALTAIALLFGVFLTQPSPICVLDEVDAPLDDANIDRFCHLLADTADATGTRFLVITHHRVTMTRMDRLFGVTMAERGVSQLVSVDLARAVELRRSA